MLWHELSLCLNFTARPQLWYTMKITLWHEWGLCGYAGIVSADYMAWYRMT